MLKIIEGADLSSVERDIDSYLILSRSLRAFNVKNVFNINLADDECVDVKNTKMLNAIDQLNLNIIPENVQLKRAKEFPIGGFGDNQIFMLILYLTSQNFESEQSEENGEMDDDNNKLEILWKTSGKKFLLSNVIKPALERLKNAKRKSFLYGMQSVEKIKIFHEDYDFFASQVDDLIEECNLNGKLAPYQILFYKNEHGMLAEPTSAGQLKTEKEKKKEDRE